MNWAQLNEGEDRDHNHRDDCDVKSKENTARKMNQAILQSNGRATSLAVITIHKVLLRASNSEVLERDQ